MLGKESISEPTLLGPLHAQVRDVLRDRIISLQWTPGMAIPSESDLAREMRVSVGTMRQAIKALENESLVVRFRGRGTFVSELNEENTIKRFSNIMHRGRKVELISHLTNLTSGPATNQEARQLNLQPEDGVYRIIRSCNIPQAIRMVEKIVVPTERFPELDQAPMLNGSTLFSVYRTLYNVIVANAEEAVCCINATRELARDLEVEDGEAVMCADRTAKAFDGETLEWSRRFIHLQQAQYVVSM